MVFHHHLGCVMLCLHTYMSPSYLHTTQTCLVYVHVRHKTQLTSSDIHFRGG